MRTRLRLVLACCALSAAALALQTGAGTPSAEISVAPCTADAASQSATTARFFVDPTIGKTPIGKTFCGPFLGAGSHAMVSMVSIPSCGISDAWLVFRDTGTAWEPVLKVPEGALSLDPVGSDIRETRGVLQPGDPHCFPSAKRTRIWHWNGSQFTATAWKTTPTKPGQPGSGVVTLHFLGFRSPTHNLWCSDGDESYFFCSSLHKPLTAELSPQGILTVCDPCKVNTKVFASGRPIAGSPVLGYGHTNEIGNVRCRSETTGITCTLISGAERGKGFTINGAGIRRVR